MNGQEVATAAPKIGAEIMEKVLLQGDLKGLSPAERLNYYNSVCQSLGLNPLTRPFEYLSLNGKLILYAKRECTEQLRYTRDVSVSIKARELTEGCYVVTAMATLPSGRSDESIGAVPLDGLKGEARANAIMKAETKAKRRVTLSICGLAFLDEIEVDSVRGANRVEADAPDADPDKPWNTYGQMIEAFGVLRGRLPEADKHLYHEVLWNTGGVHHSNEFKNLTDGAAKAIATYRQLRIVVEELEADAGKSDAAEPEVAK